MQVYLHIYNTYCANNITALQVHDIEMTPPDVYVTSSCRIDVILKLCACWVGLRQVCKKLSDLENEVYRVQ